ncbi:MAG: coproporphyrinogen III oxidase [Rhodobacteraceae bacterium]|nr:coproporphyrinogen III oxidase [Paracoccaceae bacterium]
MNNWQVGGFGLYVHWPFCEAKCPYCDFNSHVVGRIDQTRWKNAYLKEIKRVARELPDRVLGSIFFGGGTPSLMAPDTVSSIIEAARGAWTCANDLEITLEANPGSVEAGRFAAYRAGGVTRVSLGVQALNDEDLRRLGRLHNAQEARDALDIAQKTFERVSFDLIYARQDQNADAWSQELSDALSIGVDHLSLYQLTIEQGTAFGDRYNRGKLRGLPDEDLSADLYDITQELCTSAGLLRYEVSNHARPGSESRHNLVYWRYGDYAGIGPGAHGRLTLASSRFATETPLAPGAWLHRAENGNGEDPRRLLTPQDQAGEYLLMGLRTVEGIDMDRYQSMSGRQLDSESVQHLVDLDLVRKHDQRLFARPKGFSVLNQVVTELLPSY